MPHKAQQPGQNGLQRGAPARPGNRQGDAGTEEGGLAREAMDRLRPDADIHDVRAALARAADATEDRMGQITYDKVAFVFKSAVPFSVTGAMKLNESKPGLSEYLLPFFGFVPAKSVLGMSAAQGRAAELYRDLLPAGARTADQADHSRLLRELIHDFKQSDPEAGTKLLSAVGNGQLRPNDIHNVVAGIKTTPLQYQVSKLTLPKAMKVWDLANEQERDQLRLIILKKFSTTKTLSADEKLVYWRAFSGGN